MTRDEVSEINPQAILWDDLDEAILCMASRENGVLSFFDSTGEVLPKLDEEVYNPENFDEEDDIYDHWSRSNFTNIVVYDINTIIDILSKDMEVDESELDEFETIEDRKLGMAYEFFSYNIEGGYVGDFTPLHVFLTIKEE